MAIDTPGERRSALNYGIFGPFRNGPIPDGSLANARNRRHMLHHYSGLAKSAPSTAFLYDLRVFNKALDESGGLGDDPNNSNLGTISYIFDDMTDNEGKVTLPFG